jgi:phosphate starvation-inducible PhoH-like protein
MRLCLLFAPAILSHGSRDVSLGARRKNIKANDLLWSMYDEEIEPSVLVNSQDLATKTDLFIPRTPNQCTYHNMISNEKIQLVIASGPAGTGKTLFPTQYAAQQLMASDQKIVITRPLICVDEELGYLPGGINQKMDPWTIPIFDVLREFFSQQMLDKFILDKRLEVVPLAFMRGRTFKNTLVIGDELQNTSINQMLMLLTRIGDNSKMIVTGDVNQCDHTENGLMDLIERIERRYDERGDDFHEALRADSIGLVELGVDDVQRSKLITTVLDIYA